jgi:uncharacterized protein (DUF1330 family)
LGISGPARSASDGFLAEWDGGRIEAALGWRDNTFSTEERTRMAKKGYWIAHVEVTNPERYKDYVAANAAAFRKYNGRFLVRAGESVAPEGSLASRRHVVIEFESYAEAMACYESPEYRAAAKLRQDASTGDLVIIEGYDG